MGSRARRPAETGRAHISRGTVLLALVANVMLITVDQISFEETHALRAHCALTGRKNFECSFTLCSHQKFESRGSYAPISVVIVLQTICSFSSCFVSNNMTSKRILTSKE